MPRATQCVFAHAKIEITSSKGVHCTHWENLRTCRSAFPPQLQIAPVVVTSAGGYWASPIMLF